MAPLQEMWLTTGMAIKMRIIFRLVFPVFDSLLVFPVFDSLLVFPINSFLTHFYENN